METMKVKTMAEMASDYGLSELDFSNQISLFTVFQKNNNPPFDGNNFFPIHQQQIYEKIGSPFQPSLEPQPEPEPQPQPIILEPIRPIPTGIRINLNFSETEVQDLIKELVGVFAMNYHQPINLPVPNQEKS